MFKNQLFALKCVYQNADHEECFRKAYETLGDELKYTGAYFLDENGFWKGDASDDDIIDDCIKLHINDTDNLFPFLNHQFLYHYKNNLRASEEDFWNRRQLKVLRITDMKYDDYSGEYTSDQISCFGPEGWHDWGLQDNGGDPDGNMWLLVNFDEDSDEYKNAVSKGAVPTVVYVADYAQDIKDDVQVLAKDYWAGYSADYVAYFTSKEDADGCQRLYNSLVAD